MTLQNPPTLIDRLTSAALAWSAANDATPARLGRLAINDGGFFTRIGTPDASTTTVTLEKFARFLVDPANWPDGEVAEEAKAFAHVTGISLAAAAPSAGNAGELSSEAAA